MSTRTTVDPRSPTTTVLEARQSASAGVSPQADQRALDAQLRAHLARRRAVRLARREAAAAQARLENERAMQRALLGAGLAQLR